MISLKTILKKEIFDHHAYGVESISEGLAATILENIDRTYYSYIFDKKYDQLKVSDARDIRQLQSEKTQKKTLFVLSFSTINREAQNALLKVLEEPAPNTYFVLIFPDARNLLPTLRSRLQIVSAGFHQEDDQHIIEVDSFINLSLQERFEWIKKNTDKKNATRITKREVLSFCNELEKKISGQSSSKDLYHAILLARGSVSANGASIKMILEMLAMQI